MIFFFLGLVGVLLVGILSRDHDLTASQETVVTANLRLSDVSIALLPDRVHLSRCAPSVFTYPDPMRDARDGLGAEGFADAGVFSVEELPGTCVRLMAHAKQGFAATIYDQAGAGVWVEVSSRYEDGRRWIHTTLEGRGLESRPGNTLVSLPGSSLAELLARARGDRPTGGLSPVSPRHLVSQWEQDYADWIEVRKARIAGEKQVDEAPPEKPKLPLAA